MNSVLTRGAQAQKHRQCECVRDSGRPAADALASVWEGGHRPLVYQPVQRSI